MAVELTPEARKYLTPSTVADLPKRKPKEEAALFSDLRAAMTRFGPRRRLAVPALAGALVEVDGVLALDAAPVTTPSILALAVLVRLTWLRSTRSAALAFTAHRLGALGAVEALIEASSIEVDYPANGEVMLQQRPVRVPLLGSTVGELVMRASPSERASIEALVRERWEGAALPARMVMCEALVHRADLANGLVDTWLGTTPRDGDGWRMLIARIDDLDAATRLVADASSASVVDLVRRFDLRALPMLVAALESAKDTHALKHLSRAVAVYDDPRAARVLGKVATRSSAQPFVLEFFARHPQYAEEALAPHTKGKSRAAQAVAEILARVRRSTSSADAASAPPTSDSSSPRARTPKVSSTLASLPRCLSTPPWTKEGKITAPLPVVEICPASTFTRRILADASVDASRRTQLVVDQERPFDPDAAAAFVAAVLDPSPSLSVRGRWTQLPRDAALALYASWPAHRMRWHGMAVDAIVWLGPDALDGLVAHAAHAVARDDHAPQWALRVVAPEMAVALLGGADDPTHAPLVGDWLASHRDAAIAGIVPAAVGAPGAARTLAERGVIELARRHGPAFVREASRAIAPEIGDAIDELLSRRVSVAGPSRAPKLGAAFRAGELPPVRLRGRDDVLPLDAIMALAIYLSRSGHAHEHPAIAEVREGCEPADLAELAWTLARGWELAGGKTRDAWMIDALVSLARDDDDVVRRVLPNLKKDRALEVLGSIGSDAAAVELLGATTRGHKTWHAKREIARIAKSRELAHDDLVESLTPSFLEGRSMRFEHDGSPYTLELDDQFELVLRDASDRVTKRLPTVATPSASDLRAHARVTEVKADVAMLVEMRLHAMERRMIAGRTLPQDELERRHRAHPLWAPLARRLVWSFHLGTASEITGTFRIAEDGTLADEHDRPIEIPAHAHVGIPHPWRLDDATRLRWITLFHDYAIVQPFPQLGRALHRPTDDDLKGTVIVRPTGVVPNGDGGGALDIAAGFVARGTMTHRMDVGDGLHLHAAITTTAPHTVTLTASGPRDGVSLAKVGALRVAEHLAFFGAV